MKTKGFIIITALLLLGIAGCKNPEGKKSQTTEAKEVKKKTSEKQTAYKIVPEKTTIHWTGTKPTGEHHGTVKIKKGTLHLNGKEIQQAKVVMDMTSIKNEDIQKEKMRKKLVGHLKSEDFFNVGNYPEASFELTNSEKIQDKQFTHSISGNLTIKDISKNITFKGKMEQTDNQVTFQSDKFLIDRTNWEINYKSKSVFDNLKDQFIHDDITLQLQMVAKK